jgi:hypothetical protein
MLCAPQASTGEEVTSEQIGRWHCPASSTMPRRPMQQQLSGRWNSSDSTAPPSQPSRRGNLAKSPWTSSPAVMTDHTQSEYSDRRVRQGRCASNISFQSARRVPVMHEPPVPHMTRDLRAAFTRTASSSSILSQASLGNLSSSSSDDEESDAPPCIIHQKRRRQRRVNA